LHAIFALHSKPFQLLSKYLWLQADFLQSEKEAILETFPARNFSKEVANQNSKSHILTLN